MTPYLLILAVLLGIAPGLIAHGKGRNFFLWWIYGVLLGPVALLHAILLRRHVVPSPFAPSPARPRMRWRSRWPAVLWAATSVAIAIVAVTVYGLFAPRDFGMPAAGPANTQLADRTQGADRARTPPSQPPAPAAAAHPEPTPTVRVTLRREPPPEEKVESAPVSPVERMVSGDSPSPAATTATTSKLERTEPREPAKTPPVAVAERTPPAEIAAPAIAPPTAPPSKVPTVAAIAPAAPVADPKPQVPEPPASRPATARTKTAPKPAPTDVVAVGETVRTVQIALAERGYDPGPANGRAGNKTQAAIRKFQTDRNLEPTGSIDYALLETLGIVGPRVHAFRPPPGLTVGR